MLCTICSKAIIDPAGTVVDGNHTVCAVCVLRSVKRAILYDDGLIVYINSCDYCQFLERHPIDENLVKRACFLDIDEKSILTSDRRESGTTIPQWCSLRR